MRLCLVFLSKPLGQWNKTFHVFFPQNLLVALYFYGYMPMIGKPPPILNSYLFTGTRWLLYDRPSSWRLLWLHSSSYSENLQCDFNDHFVSDRQIKCFQGIWNFMGCELKTVKHMKLFRNIKHSLEKDIFHVPSSLEKIKVYLIYCQKYAASRLRVYTCIKI